MMRKQDNLPQVFDFLQPLKERRDLEPDPHFSASTRTLITQKTRLQKSRRAQLIPFTVGVLSIVLFSIFALLYIQDNSLFELRHQANQDIPIGQTEQLEPVFTLTYGSGNGEVGKRMNDQGGLSAGIDSFYIRDGTLYIMDNVNHRVLITDTDGGISHIAVEESPPMTDIYVDEKKNLYVLRGNSVEQFNPEGLLQQTYPVDLKIPLQLKADHDNRVIVAQSQDSFMYLESGEKASPKRTLEDEVLTRKMSDTLGKILIYESGERHEIDVEFEESFGELTAHGKTEHQVIFTKTEVVAEVKAIIVETHVYVADNRNGSTLGAARIPTEKMREVPRYFIRVAENRIYLLSPEETKVVVYELTPGKQYERNLQN